jgi:hypothetical protein
MLDDPRYVQGVGDGRKFLLERDDRYDIVTVDTLRSTSAFSGSLYSREFYDTQSTHIHDNGIVAQWVPTPRVANHRVTGLPLRASRYRDRRLHTGRRSSWQPLTDRSRSPHRCSPDSRLPPLARSLPNNARASRSSIAHRALVLLHDARPDRRPT